MGKPGDAPNTDMFLFYNFLIELEVPHPSITHVSRKEAPPCKWNYLSFWPQALVALYGCGTAISKGLRHNKLTV